MTLGLSATISPHSPATRALPTATEAPILYLHWTYLPPHYSFTGVTSHIGPRSHLNAEAWASPLCPLSRGTNYSRAGAFPSLQYVTTHSIPDHVMDIFFNYPYNDNSTCLFYPKRVLRWNFWHVISHSPLHTESQSCPERLMLPADSKSLEDDLVD